MFIEIAAKEEGTSKFQLDLTWSLSRLYAAMDGMSTSTYKRELGSRRRAVAITEAPNVASNAKQKQHSD